MLKQFRVQTVSKLIVNFLFRQFEKMGGNFVFGCVVFFCFAKPRTINNHRNGSNDISY